MVNHGHIKRAGRTTVRIHRGEKARVPNQYTVAGEYGGQMMAAAPQALPPCQPTWPDLPPGAALTLDPSRPPPTTAQRPFCDWPPGSQVPGSPQNCQGVVPPQPRLSNVGRGLHGRVLARQAATRRRKTTPSVRGIPHCRDATCCSFYCTEHYKSNSFLWKTCMKVCKRVNRIGQPPRGRLRNQGLRFAGAADAIIDLVGRGPR